MSPEEKALALLRRVRRDHNWDYEEVDAIIAEADKADTVERARGIYQYRFGRLPTSNQTEAMLAIIDALESKP